MPEFGAQGPGYSINDPDVDHPFEAYTQPRTDYWVVEHQGEVVGGGGIVPLADGEDDTCELVKMYFLPVARGLGPGARVLSRCLESAREFGYTRCYLETLERMVSARRLYSQFGFEPVSQALGNTGHFACDSFMTLDLASLEQGRPPAL